MIYQSYVLTVSGAPKSVNAGGGGSRSHWGQAHREKMRWQDTFGMELLVGGVEKPMQFAIVGATIRWKHRNHRDSTNWFQPVYKPLLDALVSGGYIKDDTDEWVKVSPVAFEYPEQWSHADPRVKAEMVITIEGAYL